MPLVSVIIPTYNHQNYVLEALDSVFAQTFDDYEIIVINDGSPDNTAEVLRPLAESGKIKYIEQQNQGQSAARNRGISEAQGEFIALLDDDDRWPPEKLQWQIATLQKTPEAALVYGQVKFIDANGLLFEAFDVEAKKNPAITSIPQACLQSGPSGSVYDKFSDNNYIVSPGLCLIRRTCLEALGRTVFDPVIQGGADDWDLYIRLSQKYLFIFEPYDALYYRVHESNASRDISKMLWSIVLIRQKMYRGQTAPELKQKQYLQLRDANTMYVSSLLNGKNALSETARIIQLFKMARYVPRAILWQVREELGSLKRRMRPQ